MVRPSNFSPIFIYLFSAFLFITFFAVTVSPLYCGEGVDSFIFQNIGLAIQKGRILYVDIFDDKGPLLLFLNYWSQAMGGTLTLMAFLVANLFCTLLCWDLIVSIWGIKQHRYCAVFLTMFTMLRFYQDGNISEEWSLLPISIPILYYVKAWKCQDYRVSKPHAFIIGLCAASVFLLRANNFAPTIGFLLWWLFLLINKNAWIDIKRLISLALLGFCIPVLCFCIYFFLKAGWNGVAEMFYASFFFNIGYFFSYNEHEGLGWIARIPFLSPVLLMVVIILVFSRKRDIDIIGPVILAFVLVLLTTGKSLFQHYLLISAPVYLVAFSWMIARKHKVGLIIFAVFLIRASSPALGFIWKVHQDTPSNLQFHNQFEAIYKHIPVLERDSIWNYNSGYAVDAFHAVGLVPMNRFYLRIGQQVSHRFAEEEQERICRDKPLWLMLNTGTIGYTEQESQFIESNYELKYRIISDKRGSIDLLKRCSKSF